MFTGGQKDIRTTGDQLERSVPSVPKERELRVYSSLIKSTIRDE